MPTLDAIMASLLHYGYFFLFPIAILEGPIITVIAGFLASQGYFNIAMVYGVVVAADLVGDLLYYALGRFGKKSVLDRWGKYVGLHVERLVAMERHFHSAHGGKTILFGKLTHSVGFMVLMAAGAAKMPLKKFFWYNFWGTLPKSLLFTLIGYFFGYAYNQVNSYIEKVSLILFIIVIAVAGYVIIRKKTRVEKE